MDATQPSFPPLGEDQAMVLPPPAVPVASALPRTCRKKTRLNHLRLDLPPVGPPASTTTETDSDTYNNDDVDLFSAVDDFRNDVQPVSFYSFKTIY